MIGFAFCGSFCTHARALAVLRGLRERGEDVLPIFSPAAAETDTRFGSPAAFTAEAERVCGRRGVYTVKDAEPLGPKAPLSELIVCPCTGTTLARLAAGLSETAVTMAAKAHLRRNGRILLAPATNDAMGASLANIAALYNRKNYYFLPMLQDDPEKKPYSLVSCFELLPEALDAMREGRQLLPLFREIPEKG